MKGFRNSNLRLSIQRFLQVTGFLKPRCLFVSASTGWPRRLISNRSTSHDPVRLTDIGAVLGAACFWRKICCARPSLPLLGWWPQGKRATQKYCREFSFSVFSPLVWQANILRRVKSFCAVRNICLIFINLNISLTYYLTIMPMTCLGLDCHASNCDPTFIKGFDI